MQKVCERGAVAVRSTREMFRPPEQGEKYYTEVPSVIPPKKCEEEVPHKKCEGAVPPRKCEEDAPVKSEGLVVECEEEAAQGGEGSEGRGSQG